MKIILPIAGKGTRLRPHTHVIPKSLIRVAGKPIIDYIIEQIQNINFSEIIFIIGHLGEEIQNYIFKTYNFKMKFIRQYEFKGLGHAIFHAKDCFENDESVLILLGDIIFTADIGKVVELDENQIGVMEVKDARKFGVVMIDKNGNITNMIEKPENPPTNLAISGIYYFKSSFKLFNAIEYIIKEKILTKNEYQLTDAMKRMMYMGEKFKIFYVPEWYDCGEKDTLLETNKIMLTRYATNDRINGSIILPPVFIGKDCVIENSIIGPYVSVSEGSYVKNSIIKNSILGKETSVENTILDKSLIGDNSILSESSRELNIGPDSEIILTK